jgi:hypothetical protein
MLRFPLILQAAKFHVRILMRLKIYLAKLSLY